MRKLFIFSLLLHYITDQRALAQEVEILSPDKQLRVVVSVNSDQVVFGVSYQGKVMLENSPLGLVTGEEDFSSGMKYLGKEESGLSKKYRNEKIKKSEIDYKGIS